MATTREIRQIISDDQRQIISSIWRHFLQYQEWPLTRVLHKNVKDIGDIAKVKAAIDQLGGSIVTIAGSYNAPRYALSMLGILLSEQGEAYEKLLSDYLKFTFQRCDDEPSLMRINSGDVQQALGLQSGDASVLGHLVFEDSHFSQGGNQGPEDWSAEIPLTIEDVPTDDPLAYVQEIVGAKYDPQTPVDPHKQRMLPSSQVHTDSLISLVESRVATSDESTKPTLENAAEAIRLFSDLSKQLEAEEYEASSQDNFLSITSQLQRLHAAIERIFGADSHYLRELASVRFRYARAKQKNAIAYFNRDRKQVLSVLQKIIDELRLNYPEVQIVNDSISVVAPELQVSLARFRQDHPTTTKTAFIMMSFQDTPSHNEITRAIKSTLSSLGIDGVRADDKDYHTDLYSNILTYIHGCDFGIAVFDQIVTAYVNPNVAFEVGYMLALNKQVCLLKDKTMPNLQADLIGKLYIGFNPQEIQLTIQATLSRWLNAHITS